MSELGVFAVDRGIFDHPLFDEKIAFSKREAWLWLLAEAAWKDTRRNIGGRIVEVNRGQVAHSIRFMAEAWGWPKTNVARFLERLKSETMIGTETGTGLLLITICKYDDYQRVALPKRDTSGTASGTEVGHEWDRLEDIQSIQEEVPSGTSSTAPSKPKRDDTADIEAALQAYAKTAERCGLAKIRELAPPRRRKLAATLKRHGLDGWREALAIVEATPFLNGHGGKDWRVGLDFLLQPSSFLKVIEGQYGKPASANGQAVADPALVTLPADHPDVLAIERLRGKPVIVGSSGRVTVTRAEIAKAKREPDLLATGPP